MGVIPLLSSWGLGEQEGHLGAPLHPSEAVRSAGTGGSGQAAQTFLSVADLASCLS